MNRSLRQGPRLPSAFSLIELMAAMTVLAVILLLTTQILQSSQESWTKARASSTQFREARIGFDRLTDRIAQATLNTYWDYVYESDGINPRSYTKASELHFVTGPASTLVPSRADFQGHAIFFQAPFGRSERLGYRQASSLLNAWGYLVQFESDVPQMPGFVATGGIVEPRYRFRLLEFQQPTEELEIFDPAAGSGDSWYSSALTDDNLKIVAENILALIILPMRSDDLEVDDLSPDYVYNTKGYEQTPAPSNSDRAKNELPPLLRITMIAVDEQTTARLQGTEVDPHPSLVIPGGLFLRSEDYAEDLRTLEEQLISARINYRVFTTTIPIRNSKWSEGA